MSKKIELSESDIQKIERLAGYGLTMEEIAHAFDVSSKTFQRLKARDQEFDAAMKRGLRVANDNVARVAYTMAISGKVPAMTMFWLKCRAHWKEVQHHEHSGALRLEDMVDASWKNNKSDSGSSST